MRLSRVLALILLSIAATSIAAASPVSYTLTGYFDSYPEQISFSYTAPAFISSAITIPSADLPGCINCGSSVELLPNVPISVFPDVPHADVIEFSDEPFLSDAGLSFVFPLGTLSTLGVSQTISAVEISPAGIGTLVVGPEPATFLTVGTLWIPAFLFWKRRCRAM